MRPIKEPKKDELFDGWLWIAAVVTTLALVLVVSFACDVRGAEFRARYTESPDADVAVCQLHVRKAGVATPVVSSEEFPALRNGQPRDVAFTGTIVSAVGDTFTMHATCKDEAGLSSAESNELVVVVTAPPPPPNLPPAPPTVLDCGFTVSLPDGAVRDLECEPQP